MIITDEMKEKLKENNQEINMDKFKENKFELMYKMLMEDYKDSVEQKEMAYTRLNNMSRMFSILHTLASESINDLDTILQARINEELFKEEK